MRYAGLIKNDLAAAPGVCVSFFVQGCPLRCPGCHNPESWDFEGGMEFSAKTLNDILTSLSANGIERPLCIMGGEPLCTENLFLTTLIIKEVRQ
jgi:anaerobic ribonucleoside-triphosphate reductase activating protein